MAHDDRHRIATRGVRRGGGALSTFGPLPKHCARTYWHVTQGLESIPYSTELPRELRGRLMSSGSMTTRRMSVSYRKRSSQGACRKKSAKPLAAADIKAALDYGFERSPNDVREYLEENFKLAPPGGISELASEGTQVEPGERSATPTMEPVAGSHLLASGLTDTESERETSRAWMSPTKQQRPWMPSTTEAPQAKHIERFAKAQGFRKDGDERYFHDDGSWLGRARGNSFPWENEPRRATWCAITGRRTTAWSGSPCSSKLTSGG